MSCSWYDDSRLLDAYERLNHLYRLRVCDEETMEPLNWLIFAILSQRTRHDDAIRAYMSLLRAFGSWDNVLKCPTHKLEHTIDSSTWPDTKAVRIKESLGAVHYWRRGRLSLDHLYTLPDWEAGVWMERLPGVGRKTAYCVLLFSRLRRAVLPVDTGCRRFAVRYGVLSRSTSWNDAHFVLRRQLPDDWDAIRMEQFHDTIKRLTQDFCTHDPSCGLCPLGGQCPFGRRRLNGDDEIDITRRRGHPSSFQESLWQMRLAL